MEKNLKENISETIRSEQLDVLKHEYNNSSVEYNEILKEYRKQTNLMNYYITAFTGVLLFLFSTIKETTSFGILHLDSEYIFSFTLTFSISLLYYIYSNGVDIVYNLYLVEAKRAVLEQRINKMILDTNLLNWDSKIVRHFNETLVYNRGWFNPSFLTGIASAFSIIMITIIHCLLAYQLIPNLDFKYYFTIVSCIVSSFLLHQFFILHSSGRKYIFDYIYSYNSIEKHFIKTKFNIAYIPMLTFLVGSFAFIIFSIKENAFWYTSKVDFPYIFIWTMSVGDTFFLPIINYKLGNLLLNTLEADQIKRNKNFLIQWSIGLFIVSFILNSISHYAWGMDNYTDFMGLIPGQLTIGGWWHWVFSIFEMLLVGFFYLIWFIAIKENNLNAIEQSKKLWWWVFLFSSLMIANFIQQYFTVYNQPIFEALQSAKFTFVPCLINVAMRIYLLRKEKLILSKSSGNIMRYENELLTSKDQTSGLTASDAQQHIPKIK